MDLRTADRLRDLRRAQGLTQEALAGILGVSRQAVSKWEQGISSPDTDNLIALAKVYHVSLDELLTGTGIPHSNTAAAAEPEPAVENGPRVIETEDDTVIKWLKGSYPILCTIAFFLLGFVCDLWAYSWLVFLTIPLFYTAIPAARNRNHKAFAYPVLLVLVYLIAGFMWDFWAWGWLIFMTIPIYYTIPSK
ncbi:MAG: helix-turn-helix transcriptional regulator [Clostridiaceae bacterium]|nr:helix-turn-helix transcriptional regulator [Clostridiaceae bacterium]